MHYWCNVAPAEMDGNFVSACSTFGLQQLPLLQNVCASKVWELHQRCDVPGLAFSYFKFNLHLQITDLRFVAVKYRFSSRGKDALRSLGCCSS